jgi:hypothetical protein
VGIPKDGLADEDEEPYIFGEMDRDSHMVFSLEENLKFSDLGRLAFAAYNHGAMRIILNGRKAYVVTSDEEQWLSYEAERAEYGTILGHRAHW